MTRPPTPDAAHTVGCAPAAHSAPHRRWSGPAAWLAAGTGGDLPAGIGYTAAAVAAFGLALSFAFVCAEYPIDWAEGRVFDTARLILEGSPLYCDIDRLPCADLTYPPLYSALVAGLEMVFGVGFRTGRAVSFAALVWILVSLYRIARAQFDERSALAAPAVFLFFIEVCFFAGVLRPDVLSLALVLAAIDVLIRRPTVGGAVCSAFLMLLGLFTKPHSLAAVFAACVFLALRDRKRLVAFVTVGMAGGALIFGLGQLLTGGRFVDHHLRYVMSQSNTFIQLRKVLFYGALPWAIFIAVALYHSLRALRQPLGLLPIYFLTSVAWALATGGKDGAAPNYLFELYVATSLAVAGFLHARRGRPSEAAGRLDRLAAVLLSIQVILCLGLNPWIGLERYFSNRKLWSGRETMVPALRAAPEPILVEELGVAGYTGHRLFVNSYIVTRLSNLHQWDEGPLLALLRSRRFSRVVLREAPADHPSELQRERFTPGMLQAIAANYRVSWSDGNWFVYEPREGDAPDSTTR